MPPQNEQPKLLPTRKQSLSQAVSDVFTSLIQPEKTGLDPQEIGRGYSVQQPEPYEAMPSTPKGFKTVKSLDDFIRVGKEDDIITGAWKNARNRLENTIRWLRRNGEIETKGESIAGDIGEYLSKKFGIKGDEEYLRNLPLNLKQTLDYLPQSAKNRQKSISYFENKLEEIKDKPILLRYTPKNELENPELLTSRGEIQGSKLQMDVAKTKLKETEQTIKDGYKFILENKDNLIKGFNNFVRQTDDEIEADVKRIFGKPNLKVVKEAEKATSSLNFIDEIKDDDLMDAIDHFNLMANRNMSKGIQDAKFEKIVDVDPRDLMPEKSFKGKEFGWLKSIEPEKRAKEFEKVYGRDIEHIFKLDDIPPAIEINGDLSDGFGRAHLAYALGEKVKVAKFKGVK